MEAGRVHASGPINALQSDPTLQLAAARDASVSVDAVVEDYDAACGLATLGVDGGHFLIPSPWERKAKSAGCALRRAMTAWR